MNSHTSHELWEGGPKKYPKVSSYCINQYFWFSRLLKRNFSLQARHHVPLFLKIYTEIFITPNWTFPLLQNWEKDAREEVGIFDAENVFSHFPLCIVLISSGKSQKFGFSSGFWLERNWQMTLVIWRILICGLFCCRVEMDVENEDKFPFGSRVLFMLKKGQVLLKVLWVNHSNALSFKSPKKNHAL